MNILMVSDYPVGEGGGIEVQTYIDAMALVCRGHTVTLMSTRKSSDSYSRSTEIPIVPGISCVYTTSELEMLDIINRHEIIHVNATFSLRDGMMSVLRLAYAAQKRYIVTLHTSIHHVPFSRLSGVCADDREYLLKEFVQYIDSALCTIVGVSHSIQSTLDYLGVRNKPTIVHNAKDWSKFVQTGLCVPVVDILYIGEVSMMKGVHILIQALYELSLSGQQFTARIVGDGHEKHGLVGLAESLGLLHAVEFVPYIEHEHIPDMLASGRFLVLPSLTETWGNIAMEAMGVGTPVICSDCEGLLELINNGELGFLFHRGSVVSLVNAISTATGLDDTKRQSVIQGAFETVRSRYSMENRIRSLVELYRQVS